MQIARLAFTLTLLLAVPAFTAEPNKPEAKPQNFAAILIWGTDSDKPEGKNLKEVDTSLKEKFKKIFKWKNYFEVTRKPFSIKPGDTHLLKLSSKCDVKVHQSEKEGMEVELIGEGNFVVKRKQAMPLTDILILAGDDKNSTAWFVVIKPE